MKLNIKINPAAKAAGFFYRRKLYAKNSKKTGTGHAGMPVYSKTGTNEFHHYRYATSAEVLGKINTALVKQKLCSMAVPKILQQADVTTAKGTIEHIATVKIGIMLINGESGESISFSGIGTGQDSGDKAVMKAQIAANMPISLVW